MILIAFGCAWKENPRNEGRIEVLTIGIRHHRDCDMSELTNALR